MRILTNSPRHTNGLIKINEASEFTSQNVYFCIPIEQHEISMLIDKRNIFGFFRKGISVKFIGNGETRIMSLRPYLPEDFQSPYIIRYADFTISFDYRYSIHFYISGLNYKNNVYGDNLNFSFTHYYAGSEDIGLIGKKFLLLEPDWKTLDRLFLENNVLITDWTA